MKKSFAAYAKDDLDTTSVIKASIDKNYLRNLKNYRVISRSFHLVIPVNVHGKLSLAHTKAVSDGYWLFLKPLPPGQHVIIISGEKSLYDDVQYEGYRGEDGRFKTDVIYHATIG